MPKRLSLSTYIPSILLSVAAGLIFTTVFALDSNLAEGVISAKYFRFYTGMGVLCVLATAIFLLKKKLQFRISLSDILLVLFSAATLLPAFIHSETLHTKHYLFILLIVLYFYFRLALSTFRLFRTVVTLMLIITALVEAVWGLLQLYGFTFSQHSLFQLTGSFFNPGPYAGYLTTIMPVAFYYFVADNKVWKRRFNRRYLFFYIRHVLSAGTIVSIILVLPAAMSRAAWLAAISGCLLALLTYYGKKHKLQKVFVRYRKTIFIITPLLVMLMFSGGYSMYHLKKDSADGRTFIWKNTLTAIVHHPTGVGLGNFAGTYGQTQALYFESGKGTEQEALVAGNPEYAFNEYLQTALETGWVGWVLLLSVFMTSIVNGFKLRHPETTSALLSILVFATMSYPFSVLPFLIVLTFILADTATPLCTGTSLQPTVKPFTLKIVLILSVCVTSWCILQRYPTYKAYKEWGKLHQMFASNLFDNTAADYEKLYPYLSDRAVFLFEYGQVLSKNGNYSESNRILTKGIQISCDPMFYNIMGKNYQALKDYQRAEQNFKTAANIVPNRLYPYYLLTKLYTEWNNTEKMVRTARIVLQKEPKVHSPAVEEMRNEVKKLKN